MEVKLVAGSGVLREYRVEIARSEVAAEISARLRRLARDVRLPGFRPGKVPPAELHRRFGESVRKQVFDEYVSSALQQLREESGIEPLAQPAIQLLSDEGELSVVQLTLEVLPSIEVLSLEALQCELMRCEPTHAEIRWLLEPAQAWFYEGTEDIRGLVTEDPADLSAQQLAALREALGAAFTLQAKEHLQRQLLDQLVARHDFAVPQVLIEQELAGLEAGLSAAAQVECHALAERRVRLGLLFAEISRRENIVVTSEELSEAWPESGDAELSVLTATLMERKVTDFLLNQLDINERRVSAEQFLAAIESI